VQVLGDHHGNLVHLFERECSVQRRFQKIIEESPSPALDAAARARICETAAGIARRAGYRNAGTVEFILGADGAFYFLEMNTRLQVEHPVTEQITGLDLVREQLRIAAGEPLGYDQAQVHARGHAIEYRVYAEDPAAGFLPTTGPLLAHRPPTGEGVRVDAGVAEGQTVSAAFDPMLAKLIVTGDTREQARERADRALADYVLLGCRSNLAFLRRLNAHQAFAAGEVHTGLLDADPSLAEEQTPEPEALLRLLAAAALVARPLREAADSVPAMHAAMGAWRN
jgi:acetyl/propionyl-CoA carboxylase alpha subunit